MHGASGKFSASVIWMRPARSKVPGSDFTSGDAAFPAAQITVRAWMKLSFVRTPSALMSCTLTPSCTVTLRCRSCSSALRESSTSNTGSTRSAASSKMIRASRGSMCLKSRSIVSRAISEMAPAISTPVGPAPTMTKVISRSRSTGSLVTSAFSNASSRRRRMSSASSSVFSPGANCSHSGWPK